MGLNEDSFTLRSVVLVEVQKIPTNGNKEETIITGQTTAVIKDSSDDAWNLSGQCFLYDPYNASKWQQGNDDHGTPWTSIAQEVGEFEGDEPLSKMARERGTIFIYKKNGDDQLIM